MRSYKVARRAFLRACGASPLLVPLLRNIEAQAAGVVAPLKLLIIHQPLGTFLDDWRPNSDSTTNFTLPTISAPLAPLQSKMVMVDGLDLVATSGDETHEGGMIGMMGSASLGKIETTQQDHAAQGPSIDQLLLDQSPVLGGAASASQTPFGSLQLAADIRSDRDEVSPRVMSYRPALQGEPDISRARQPMFPETQPLNVFNRIFGGDTAAPDDPDSAATILAQKASVLDVLRGDLAQLRTMVPSDQLTKVEAHEDAIRQLEASIQQTYQSQDQGNPDAGAVCVRPEAPPSFNETGVGEEGSALSGVDYYVPGDPNTHPHQTLGRLQLSLIKTAFACDLARVGTFMWSAGTNHVVFPGTFNGASLNKQSSPHHPPSHEAETQPWLAEINTWYAQQTSEAIQEFEQQIDVDGATLLDNTIVAFVSEVARAVDHNFSNVPFAVFGGANTGLAAGQFIRLTGNRPINDAWMAIAQLFDVNLSSLGASSQYTGVLPGLVG